MERKTFRGALFACAALLAWSSATPVDAQQGQQTMVIRGGTLIDGLGGPPLQNSVIVIQGNRITAVGAAGQVQVPQGAEIIDATGKWITPGLVDAKANWNWQYAEAFLTWGVTSAMITGTRNDTGVADRDAINHGMWPGPRLYQGVINLQGGGMNGDRPDNYVPGDGGRRVHTPEEARAQVRYNIASGADFIGTNDGDAPPEVFAAAADEAHRAGLGVVMRCVGPGTLAKSCVEAGADVMIHTGEIGNVISAHPENWTTYIGLPPDAYCDMDPEKEQDMIEFLLQHDTAIEPDFIATGRGFPVNWARVQEEDARFFDDPDLRAYYPEYSIGDLLENVKSPETFLTPDKLEHRACGFRNHAKFTGDLVRAGGHALVASDITQSAPGLGVHQEMAVFQEDAGIEPMKVLMAATSWVAHHFRIEGIGSIEAGNYADIIIANADPLIDIKNLRDIHMVIKDGAVWDRKYHPWFRGWIFANDPHRADFGPVVEHSDWAEALKRATFRPNVNAFRGEPGIPGVLPDFHTSPTPGIEEIYPHTVPRLSEPFTLEITGFNFVRRSVVYIDEIPVPTEVVSRTEIRAEIDAQILAVAGNKRITVRNPLPMAEPLWGDRSNPAHLLVPFEFTTRYSHNEDVTRD
jgi:imidazolonepropionase-like amidohydrolase